MKKILLLSFFISLGTWSQNMSQREVVQDLNFLSDQIATYNPALSGYHPEFKNQSNQVIQSVVADSLSLFEYYTLVSQICSLSHEGHFKLGDREDALRQGILSNTYTYLPLQVKIMESKVWVNANFSDEQNIPKGSQIVAINGRSITSILERLLAVTPSDGAITTYSYRKIEDGFASLYHYHIEQTNSFEITYIDSDQEQTTQIKALVRSAQIENIKKFYPPTKAPTSEKKEGFYSLKFEDGYALLKLPSFDFRRVNQFEVKSKKMYASIFKTLKEKKVTNLVIDLRDNTGGRNEFADDMVPFIMKQDNGDRYLKKTISWEGKERTYKLPKPSKLAFTGSLYVLVNGKTYSAGHSLARYLKEYGNAVTIGTEAGTRYEGFAAGSTQDILLPNSGIKIGIPRYLILFTESKKQTTSHRGLLPDHPIERTFELPADAPDPYLQKVRSLINTQ